MLQIVLPIAILVVGVGASRLIVAQKPEAVRKEPDRVLPMVRTETIALTDVQTVITSQGTVQPRTASQLVAEVGGRLLEVAPAFAEGGFFEKGDVLLQIDPIDYRDAVIQARAQVAQAEVRVASEEAEAAIAIAEWKRLEGDVPAPPLTTRELQVAEAEAALDVARSSLLRAERDLARTEVRAPYAGIVRRKTVDVGQFVTPAQPLAEIYAIDRAQVRLPLPDDELAFVELPYAYRGGGRSEGPRTRLIADFAGETFVWQGRIVRTEGEIDARSRLVDAVAEVPNPYRRRDDPNQPPLAVGMFVRAEIDGITLTDVARVPRSALREDGRLMIVQDGRLSFREVDIVRREADTLLVRGDLRDGEVLCVSTLTIATDGMEVRVADMADGEV